MADMECDTLIISDSCTNGQWEKCKNKGLFGKRCGFGSATNNIIQWIKASFGSQVAIFKAQYSHISGQQTEDFNIVHLYTSGISEMLQRRLLCRIIKVVEDIQEAVKYSKQRRE
ncbi:uncharacterized protein LOC131036856 [Cryptomeria japonica]|uniref:uncharacterized protein LOC131036856 n=1 Tax=Cryptomeria japonica TaxID=3369 RepID=UPI0027D9D83D|nr:uncharacterized protein LOC131036856 [Cryptomeria japonica]